MEIVMGFFDIFKRKKVELNEDELKWNKMWELWTEDKAESPYAELMKYQSEINNGGHDQYFTNVENTGDLEKEMSALVQILSDAMKINLMDAYEAYRVLAENDEDEEAEEILEQCDDIFYENEEEINKLLEEYASNISL